MKEIPFEPLVFVWDTVARSMFAALVTILSELAETIFKVFDAFDSPAPAVIDACISEYVVPSLVNCQVSDVSFHLMETSLELPLSTVTLAFSVGAPDAPEFNFIALSSTKSVDVFTVIIFPVTDKFPPTDKSFVIEALLADAFPLTVSELSVPTLVRLDTRTFELKVEPTNVFALAWAVVVPVTEILPLMVKSPLTETFPSSRY